LKERNVEYLAEVEEDGLLSSHAGQLEHCSCLHRVCPRQGPPTSQLLFVQRTENTEKQKEKKRSIKHQQITKQTNKGTKREGKPKDQTSLFVESCRLARTGRISHFRFLSSFLGGKKTEKKKRKERKKETEGVVVNEGTMKIPSQALHRIGTAVSSGMKDQLWKEKIKRNT
jgi:hypothetical protein